MTEAGQPIDQAAPSTAAGEVRQGAAVHPLVAEAMRINALLARKREEARGREESPEPAASLASDARQEENEVRPNALMASYEEAKKALAEGGNGRLSWKPSIVKWWGKRTY